MTTAAADTSSPVRRSSRSRKQSNSYYDDAAKAVLLEEQKRKDDNDNDNDEVDNDDDVEPMSTDDDNDDEESSDDDDNEDDDDEDFEGSQQKKKKKKTTTPSNKKKSAVTPTSASKKSTTTTKKSKKSPKVSPAVVKRRGNTTTTTTKKSVTTKNTTVTAKTAFTKTRISQALTMVSKHILAVPDQMMTKDDDLDEDNQKKQKLKKETPENSLVAALLASAKSIPGIPSTARPKTYYYAQQQQQQQQEVDLTSTSSSSSTLTSSERMTKRTNSIVNVCLPQLDGIVRHLIRTTEQNGNPHELHVQLLNLLFRSVGGSIETNINSGTDLDELEDDDWDDLISKVVTVMKTESDADSTLLCADDDDDIGMHTTTTNNDNDGSSSGSGTAGDGTTSTTATLTTRQIGTIAYRTLYKEFWYRLGHILLAHSPSPAVAMVSEEDSENENDDDDDDDDDDEENEDKEDDDDDDDENDGLFSSKKKKRKLRSSSSKKSKGNKKSKKTQIAKTTKKITPQQQGEGFSSNRFQLEKVRDLILRMTELVSVGQPDLRAAGTLAVLQLAKACVERTVELEQKIRVATRQLKVASKAGSKRKQQTLQHHLDNWKRHKAELQEMVEGPVFQGVFIHRYRDANERIRRDCLRSLSSISLIRPDIFLVDTYLKYFGWMASDKSPSVRIAALEGLSAPFRVAALSLIPVNSTSSSAAIPFPIDVATMHNVTNKFLSRIVDCIDDNESVRVQEIAIKLLLSMVHEEFLDDWEDDLGWEKINMKSFDPFSSPKVRRDALYFVMDQIETFDTDGKDASSIGDKKQSDQLLAIAKWCAIRLCDSSILADDMNIELVDYVVQSIVGMPEHRDLVLNWPMMLKAIRSENPQQGSADEREEIATQRILLRMLATSAEIEFGKASRIEQDGDSKKNNNTQISRKRKKSSSSNHVTETSLDDLSIALLKNLPNLLDAFKSDIMSLRDVTKLPLTITSSALGLPARKADFQNLAKTLCQLYIDSTDEQVLQNIAQTLSQWVEGDHTRVSEVKINLKRLSGALQDRLMELFRESDPENQGERERKSPRRNRRKKSDGSTIGESSMFSSSQEVDTEHSISLLMLRWKTLLMECKATYLFEKADEDEDEDEIEGLFFTISEAMGKRLSDRMSKHDREVEDDAATIATTPTIWKDDDPDIHEAVSQTINRALRVLLVIVSQELLETLESRKDFEASGNDDGIDMDADEHNFPVLKMRDNLLRVLGLCFDQHLPEVDGVEYSEEQQEFATSVQDSAGKVTSDLRTLFPSDWSNGSDPVRRALALTGGQNLETLLAGFVRWFQSRQESMNAKEETGLNTMVRDGLLPLARIINLNYQDFHRKEAGMLLKHINGSGSLASQTILSLTRKLKKTNPLRMLEAYMSCLKFSFENWVDNEPNEPEESAPSEEEIQKFEEAEKRHEDLFASMEQVASKLSSSLGVAGKLGNEVLKKSIRGFMREGIRFAFDGPNSGDDDELVVGSRLAFLSMLQKFTSWVKKDKENLDNLTDFLIAKETELRRHPEFDEIHPEDLNSLTNFRKSMGIKGEISYSIVSGTDGRSISMAESPASTAVSSRRRISTTGSRVSRLSGLSIQSELSPLLEEDDDTRVEDGDENSPTPQKGRQLRRADTRDDDESLTHAGDDETTVASLKRSSVGTVLEESEQEDDETDGSLTRNGDDETTFTKRSSEDDGSLTRNGDDETTYTKRSSEDDGSLTRNGDDETTFTKRSSEDDGSLTRNGDDETTFTKRSSEDDGSLTRNGDDETTFTKRSSEDDGSVTRADDDETAAASKKSSEYEQDESDDGSVTRADDDETAAASKRSSGGSVLDEDEQESEGSEE